MRIWILSLCLLAAPVHGRDLYVDNRIGDDTLTAADPLSAGVAPNSDTTPTGCTRGLYERYTRHLAEREKLLDTAHRLAWAK